MLTVKWYLMVGKQRVPVMIMWNTKGHALVQLGQTCDRGEAGENVYVSAKDVKIDQEALSSIAGSDDHRSNIQLSLF